MGYGVGGNEGKVELTYLYLLVTREGDWEGPEKMCETTACTYPLSSRSGPSSSSRLALYISSAYPLYYLNLNKEGGTQRPYLLM